jgi:alkylation response protein AidB-like acyl-CoA dehydrogenase
VENKVTKLTAEFLIEDLTADERAIAEKVEAILPGLAANAKQVDKEGEFNLDNVKLLSDVGLLGLVVPKEYGGLGGGLRDWAATCFAIGTVCPSTGLAYFFHNTSASRGNLALSALEEGLFTDEETPVVKAFAEKVLNTMGRDKKWLANYASESVKSEKSAITINTTATKVDGGWILNGEKSFGCATTFADQYLITASLDGISDASGLATFFVDRGAAGVRGRIEWDAIGMRGTATEGLVLENVFVADANALAMQGAFARSCQMSRSGFVGNQVAASVIYLGCAYSVYRTAIQLMTDKKFVDTGKSLGTGPYQQQVIGQMYADVMTATLWAQRQIKIESESTVEKEDVVQYWRTCKGQIAEYGFKVSQHALKLAGTSGTLFGTPYSRAIRDLAMGLVQAFPAERGRLQTAQMIIEGNEQESFGTGK